MNTYAAMMRNKEALKKGVASKVFDWDKAVDIIIQYNVKDAIAGLSEDWEWTAGNILSDGEIPEDSYTFLKSNWATPTIKINNGDGFWKEIPCYISSTDTEYDSKTYWPDSVKNKYLEFKEKEKKENESTIS